MLSTISNIILEYREIIAVVVLATIMFILYKKYSAEIKFWLMCLWYRVPVVGKIARLSNDISTTQYRWFKSEEVLCSDFDIQLRRLADDPDIYDSADSYLKKVQEHGRKPMGIVSWLLIIVLVVCEAAIFAYVLAGFAVPGSSEAVQIEGALLLGVVIAIILVAFTHWTGLTIHKRTLIKKARAWWNADKNENRPDITTATGKAGLGNNAEDDDAPDYIQLLNRIEHNDRATPGGHAIISITAILIIGLAIGATYVRVQSQNALLAEDAQLQEKSTESYNFGGQNAPDVLTREQKDGTTRLEENINASKLQGGYATFAVMALVFVFIQVFGVLLGQRLSFAGRESKEAYKLKSRFSSSTQYKIYHEQVHNKIIRTADSMLVLLQSKLGKAATNEGTDNELRAINNESSSRTLQSFLLNLNHRKASEQKAHNERMEKQNTIERDLPLTPSAKGMSKEEEKIRREVQAELDREEPKKIIENIETPEKMRARIMEEERAKRQQKASN